MPRMQCAAGELVALESPVMATTIQRFPGRPARRVPARLTIRLPMGTVSRGRGPRATAG
jgi:hypothetical protein